MGFSVNAGSESRLESAITEIMLASNKKVAGCGVNGCTASSDWMERCSSHWTRGFQGLI